MKHKPLLLLALFVFFLSACTSSSRTSSPAEELTEESAVTLHVFAAASLTEAFTEIGTLFETNHPGVTVAFNFAGSTQLAQQINEGAPVDVFASADQKQMEVVVDGGRVAANSAQKFVTNRLVVIYPTSNPGGIATLQDLSQPGLRLVLAAQEIPVGQYVLDFLDKAALDLAFSTTFQEEVLANVVSYEDNVKAVLAKVTLGEADAGIVYLSDGSGENGTEVSQIEIPDALNIIATYPIAPVADSANPKLADLWIAYVLSPEGQAILASYNFIPVLEGPSR